MNYFKKFQGKPSLWSVISYSLILIFSLVYIAYHISGKFSESLFQEKFVPFFIISSFSILVIPSVYIKSKKATKTIDLYKGLGWISQGFNWGYLMLFATSVLNNIIFSREIVIDLIFFYIAFPAWIIAGLFVSYVSKRNIERKTI